MFRDPLSIRAQPIQPVAMTAPTFAATTRRPPLAPTGAVARFDGGILEVAAGAGLRVAARDIVAIDIAPAAGARLLLTVSYRRRLQTIRATFWVALGDHAGLQRLVAATRAALVARA